MLLSGSASAVMFTYVVLCSSSAGVALSNACAGWLLVLLTGSASAGFAVWQ